jgi:hypothetical protein
MKVVLVIYVRKRLPNECKKKWIRLILKGQHLLFRGYLLNLVAYVMII